ncbi:MAG: hypothetical protein ACKOVB_20535 [Terrabacter sp.]
MPYRPEKPRLAESSEELRRRIPGWGVDLDPSDRPAFPRERYDPAASGAHWEFPERQPELRPRERSIEHLELPPVFGTSTPPRGLSGAIRRFAYERFSEARAAHWLLLIGADRVDAWEHHLGSLLTPRPDNPVTETGVLSEGRRHGVSSRRGPRVDRPHHAIDPLVVAGPWVLAGVLGYRVARRVARTVTAPLRLGTR